MNYLYQHPDGGYLAYDDGHIVLSADGWDKTTLPIGPVGLNELALAVSDAANGEMP